MLVPPELERGEVFKTKSRLNSHLQSPINPNEKKGFGASKNSVQYSLFDSKRPSYNPTAMITNKLFDKSPEVENTRNNSNRRATKHNMSFNIRDFSSPSHFNQTQNRSRIRDDAKHSNSIMMSPVQRESGVISPQPTRPSVGSPLVGRRKTNLESSNSRFLKNNFGLGRGKVLNSKHRKTKLLGSGTANKLRISQVKGKVALTTGYFKSKVSLHFANIFNY